jgi:plasmid stabilization system protein ParE
VTSFEVRESLAYLRDLARIEVHLTDTTGDEALAERRIAEIRATTRKLSEFPRLGPDRSDLGKDIRMLTASAKAVVLYAVQEEAGIVLMLRAFYGGEDYEALVRAETDNT